MLRPSSSILALLGAGMLSGALSAGDFVDGIAGLAPAPREAARLIAPDLAPVKRTLAPTIMPAEEMAFWQAASADLNGDGIVDDLDLMLLLQSFGACDGCREDLNGDGRVDDRDVHILIERMGMTLNVDSISERSRRIGMTMEAPADLRDSLPVVAMYDGLAVARVEFTSQHASGLRLEVEGLRRTGTVLHVYVPGGTLVLGPYEGDRSDEHDLWWTPVIDGEAIGIELAWEPLPDHIRPPSIMRTAHHYGQGSCSECATGPGTALSCHNCIACAASWQNADARAVGQMSWVATNGGCFWCTGALLNRGPGDLSPLFMTANHCISSQFEANSLEIRWLYETTTCPCGGVPGFNDVNRNNGAVLLKRHTSTDWTLLGLMDPPDVPGGAFYLGWSSSSWSSGQSATGVHHPGATHKRISYGSVDGSSNGYGFCDANGQNCFTADVWNIEYTDGTTQGGSSGSPIFDSSRRVRGTLTGGAAGCATIIKRYGRLDRAFVNLRYFIAEDSVPVGTVFVNGAFSGDPGNNGSTEQGTLAFPFNRLDEATYCVRSGDFVVMTPGTYVAPAHIWRPMTLGIFGAGEVLLTR